VACRETARRAATRSQPGLRHFKFVDDLESFATNNRIWKQRTVDIGKFTAEQALAWGSADAAGDSGVPWTCDGRSRMTNTPRWISKFGRAQRRLLTGI
jgi:NADH:ubiquinone oxidoreductase subunit D